MNLHQLLGEKHQMVIYVKQSTETLKIQVRIRFGFKSKVFTVYKAISKAELALL